MVNKDIDFGNPKNLDKIRKAIESLNKSIESLSLEKQQYLGEIRDVTHINSKLTVAFT